MPVDHHAVAPVVGGVDRITIKALEEASFIPIGQTRRPVVACALPATVRSENDLPGRLCLGSLQRGSFSRQACGWSARYVDANPRSFAEVDYAAGDKRLKIRQVWCGWSRT